MENKHIAAVLVQKRATLTGLIIDLEERTRQARQDLVHIDASIRMFDPDLDFRKISHKRPSTRGTLFAHGEVAGFCRNGLRVATDPIAAESIAIQAMQAKKLNMADSKLRKKVTASVLWSLRELRKVGEVAKIGAGLGARWELAGR